MTDKNKVEGLTAPRTDENHGCTHSIRITIDTSSNRVPAMIFLIENAIASHLNDEDEWTIDIDKHETRRIERRLF